MPALWRRRFTDTIIIPLHPLFFHLIIPFFAACLLFLFWNLRRYSRFWFPMITLDFLDDFSHNDSSCYIIDSLLAKSKKAHFTKRRSIIFFTSSLPYRWLEFSMPSVVMTNIVCAGTSSGRAYLWMFPIWWIAPPIASRSAVHPHTVYSLLVIFGTSRRRILSWRTSVASAKRMEETYVSPSSFFCFSIMALNPPMVSLQTRHGHHYGLK